MCENSINGVGTEAGDPSDPTLPLSHSSPSPASDSATANEMPVERKQSSLRVDADDFVPNKRGSPKLKTIVSQTNMNEENNYTNYIGENISNGYVREDGVGEFLESDLVGEAYYESFPNGYTPIGGYVEAIPADNMSFAYQQCYGTNFVPLGPVDSSG